MNVVPLPHIGEIKVEGICKIFEGDLQVLKEVDLHVKSGSVVALLGHNGSGKSTLLRCLTRLIEPDAGTIRIFDEDVRSLRGGNLRRLRTKVGYVFQYHNLVKRLSVLTNVLHGKLGRSHNPRLWFQCFSSTKDRSRAYSMLERVGLEYLADRRADQLSGGQSQRVAIARVLMQEPQIIVADEPVASLDPQAGEDVMELLVSLARQRGNTLLFSTHNLEHALRFSDRVVCLKGGKVELDAPTVEVDQPQLRRLYG